MAAIQIRNAKYLSACEVERADAVTLGYEQVGQHPSEIHKLGSDDILIVDFNVVQFGDLELAVKMMTDAVRNGVLVGIHTYHASPALRELLNEPLVAVAKTHRRVRAKIRRLIADRVSVNSRVPAFAAAASL